MDIEIFAIDTEIKEDSILIQVRKKKANKDFPETPKTKNQIKSFVSRKYQEVEVVNFEVITLENTGALGLELQLKGGEIDPHRLGLVAQKIKKDFKLPLSD